MNQHSTKALFTLLAATAGLTLATPSSAVAGTLYNGWNYGIDAFGDSTNRIAGSGNPYVLGGEYEIYGIAIKDDGKNISVVINANAPSTGVVDRFGVVRDRRTSWGDLFFNFTPTNLPTASASGNLLAVRFAADNEAGVAGTGVFANVTAKSVATANDGRSTRSTPMWMR